MRHEQKLIDITFQMVLAATADPVFCKKSNEDKALWVRTRLRECGFETVPVGSSWGQLTKACLKAMESGDDKDDMIW